MKTKQWAVIIGFATLSHLLFFRADWGLNILITTLLLLLGLFYQKPHLRSERITHLVGGGLLLSALFFTLHASFLHGFVWVLWLFLLVGYVHEWKVRWWFFGLPYSAFACCTTWFFSSKQSLANHSGTTAVQWGRRAIYVLVPSVLVMTFIGLYAAGNLAFGNFSQSLIDWLTPLFQLSFDISRLPSYLGWIILATAFLGWAPPIKFLAGWNEALSLTFERKRRKKVFPFSTLALTHEYRIAQISLFLLNILLVLINALDVWHVWLFPSPQTAPELSQYVHEGTWVLICSILLAIGVVLFFFRGNLHFYPKSGLKELAFLWIAQNSFLALSVAVRNGQYIGNYGLASGRIIVFLALSLVLFSLWTLYQKVSHHRSLFYMLQLNGWAFFIAFLVAASFSWPRLITRYNLAFLPEDKQDYPLLQSNFAEENLFLLLPLATDGDTPISITDPAIQRKIKRVIQKEEGRDWRSWNYSHYRNWQALEQYDLLPHSNPTHE